MSELNVLKLFGQIAGLSGLSLAVFFLLFQNLLKKIVAPRMAKKHWFIVVCLFMLLTWSFTIAGMGAWVYVNKLKPVSIDTAPQTADLSFLHELNNIYNVLHVTNESHALESNNSNNILTFKYIAPPPSRIAQVERLSAQRPLAVVDALIPLLKEDDSGVTLGALTVIRYLMTNQPQYFLEIEKRLPEGTYYNKLHLNNISIVNEDFSLFKHSTIFVNAEFNHSLIESCKFDDCNMDSTSFVRTTVLYTSLAKAKLRASDWNGCVVRVCNFNGSDFTMAKLTACDFGVTNLFKNMHYTDEGDNEFSDNSFNFADFSSSSIVNVKMQKVHMANARFTNANVLQSRFDYAIGDSNLPITNASYFKGVRECKSNLFLTYWEDFGQALSRLSKAIEENANRAVTNNPIK